ncbi:hypothetical protein [Rhizobium herbae]|uniref:Uncharacterized protein n=1 Tax=Rhizobium herbae TaxID=508661 RepID=A0ABS4EKE4_9HYPH|nr:hypothetical protein [Rhizobium herbae]MBP1858416.1 hypothetical protein [Rhizobium herbae]
MLQKFVYDQIARITLNGMAPAAFCIVVVWQILMVVLYLRGAVAAPVLAVGSAVGFSYWDWAHTDYVASLTPGKSRFTSRDRAQLYISSAVFGLPLLWIALPRSSALLGELDFGWEWSFNLAAMIAICVLCVGSFFKHFRI